MAQEDRNNKPISHPVLESIRLRIRKDLNNWADQAALGQCKNWDAYQHLTGKIQGLARAEAHLYDLADQMEKADE